MKPISHEDCLRLYGVNLAHFNGCRADIDDKCNLHLRYFSTYDDSLYTYVQFSPLNKKLMNKPNEEIKDTETCSNCIFWDINNEHIGERSRLCYNPISTFYKLYISASFSCNNHYQISPRFRRKETVSNNYFSEWLDRKLDLFKVIIKSSCIKTRTACTECGKPTLVSGVLCHNCAKKENSRICKNCIDWSSLETNEFSLGLCSNFNSSNFKNYISGFDSCVLCNTKKTNPTKGNKMKENEKCNNCGIPVYTRRILECNEICNNYKSMEITDCKKCKFHLMPNSYCGDVCSLKVECIERTINSCPHFQKKPKPNKYCKDCYNFALLKNRRLGIDKKIPYCIKDCDFCGKYIVMHNAKPINIDDLACSKYME